MSRDLGGDPWACEERDPFASDGKQPADEAADAAGTRDHDVTVHGGVMLALIPVDKKDARRKRCPAMAQSWHNWRNTQAAARWRWR
ncbi:hypothetical protein GCM10022280_26500 [Sphingomonas swuensis]|uniref:Uncharacterized protein n=1 Tax=Sphingomonas swuensis TaxID=977800 RepID=A0ABP7TCS0_9SPHN